MNLARISLLTLAVAFLAVGNVLAEEAEPTYPTNFNGFGEGGEYAGAERSGDPNPLTVSTSDVAYSGSGSATIRFTSSQRGTAVVTIYRMGSNETGARGPGGAWLRLVPQALYINHVKQPIETGNNSVTWDGRDFEGNTAGPGSYEFDVLVINLQDAPTLVGPGSRGAAPWSEVNIDIKANPPEIWAPANAGQTGNENESDYYRGTIGTDWIANPNASELWNASFFNFEGATSFIGQFPDDRDADVYWNLRWVGDLGGIYKSRINRAGRSWELDTSFGDNGFMANRNDRSTTGHPWGDFFIKGQWDVIDNPAPTVEYHDKTSGDIVRSTPVSDFMLIESTDDEGNVSFRAGGPGKMSANSAGTWFGSWHPIGILHLDADGNPIWANVNGADGCCTRISVEDAAELGVSGSGNTGSSIHPEGLADGKGMFLSEAHNPTGNWAAFLGRDGTFVTDLFANLANVPLAQNWSNRWIQTWEMKIIDEGSPGHAASGGRYKGLYYSSHIGLEDGAYENSTPAEGDNAAGGCCGEGLGPGTTFHVPFDLATGRMGAGVTAVEEVAAAGIPSSYSLSDAYPNPFNPETTIEFNVPVDEYVKIDVFNTAGQLVASMVDDELSAGSYKTTWDATDKTGSQVSSGVYFYRMQVGDYTDTRSMTLLK